MADFILLDCKKPRHDFSEDIIWGQNYHVHTSRLFRNPLVKSFKLANIYTYFDVWIFPIHRMSHVGLKMTETSDLSISSGFMFALLFRVLLLSIDYF